MIADLDESIRQLLTEEMPIKNGEIDVVFDQPKREWSARLSKPTLNFFLYDVRENATLRHHEWERLSNQGKGDLAHLKRTPYRVDCSYIITAWAADPEDEHRLLSRCLVALFRHPVVPPEILVGSLKNQKFEIQASLAQTEKLRNPAELWSAMDNEMRPSVPYMLTIALDPWAAVTGPLVKTLILKPGQSPYRRFRRRIEEGQQDAPLTFIGGTVTSQSAGGSPLAGIDVSVKGSGITARTDSEGRFVLGSLPPGEYTLVVSPPDGKQKEKKISIPAKDESYDLIV